MAAVHLKMAAVVGIFFIFKSRTVVFVLSKCDSSKEKDAGHVTKMLLSNDIFLKS